MPDRVAAAHDSLNDLRFLENLVAVGAAEDGRILN